tara:strand:+ start:34 stop:174 length:141 start_codon:yes stop_codon:yes gene_type:complete
MFFILSKLKIPSLEYKRDAMIDLTHVLPLLGYDAIQIIISIKINYI